MRTISPYVNPVHNLVPCVEASFWLEPWKSYMDTWPASRLTDAIGVNYHGAPPSTAVALAKAGIKRARIELGWGFFDYNAPDKPTASADSGWRPLIAALRDAGIRPLILLNSNSVRPCQVNNAGVYLYQPFSGPANPASQATLTGWTTYCVGACQYVAGILGSAEFDVEIWNELTFGSSFLLSDPSTKDIVYSNWGQSTQGSGAMFYQWLMAASVDAIHAAFPTVKVCNGLTNTLPYGTPASQWKGVHAVSRHFYVDRPVTPATPGYDAAIGHVNALGFTEGTPNPAGQTRFVVPGTFFVPAVGTIQCPEQHLLQIAQPWCLIRQQQAFPTPTAVQYPQPGAKSWRDNNDWLRIKTGLQYEQLQLFWRGMTNFWGETGALWETETNFAVGPMCVSAAVSAGVPVTDSRVVNLAQFLMAKNLLRLYVFHVHKGIEAVYVFALSDGNDIGYSIIPSAGITQSQALKAIENLTSLFNFYSDTLTAVVPLTVTKVTDLNPVLVFAGDGTPAHPDHFQGDDLFIGPFQASDSVYLIAVYVVTFQSAINHGTDPLATAGYVMPDAEFDIEITGFSKEVASLSFYDPLLHEWSSPGESEYIGGRLKVCLSVSDYPRFLIVRL